MDSPQVGRRHSACYCTCRTPCQILWSPPCRLSDGGRVFSRTGESPQQGDGQVAPKALWESFVNDTRTKLGGMVYQRCCRVDAEQEKMSSEVENYQVNVTELRQSIIRVGSVLSKQVFAVSMENSRT